MTDIFDDIFDEAGALGDVDVGTSKTLSDLVKTLRSVEDQIKDTELHLSHSRLISKTFLSTRYLRSWMRWAWSVLT